MQAVKTTITITGLTRTLGDRDWFHGKAGERIGYRVRDEGGIFADVEVKAEMEGCEFKALIDLPLTCPVMEQLQSAIVQAAEGVRRVAREKREKDDDTPALSEDELTRQFQRRLEDLVRTHRQRLEDLAVWHQEQQEKLTLGRKRQNNEK